MSSAVHGLPVPWKLSPAASLATQAPAVSFSVAAARLPEFFRSRSLRALVPGFCTVALKIAEQAALMFVSTPPPLPLDRHALPALTVFESTIVPVANVLPAFVVSAENVANVPEPDAIDTRPITVRSIKYCLTRFLDMVAPSWGNGVIEATRARAGLSSFVSHSRRKSLERLRTSLVVLAVWIGNA